MTLDFFETTWREVWAGAEDSDSVGAVFTKPAVVSLILDLAGYTSDRHLARLRVLEPSCGDGAFTSEIVRRVLAAERRHGGGTIDWSDLDLAECVRACDISMRAVESARNAIAVLLEGAGCGARRARILAEKWIVQADFLLCDWNVRFDFVIGNPPYVRIEALPVAVLRNYRSRFSTATDRADIYVAFFERGLQLLSDRGVLSYICANRFTKNKYGHRLRELIAERFHVRFYLNLEHTQPFLSDVSAYPAVFVIDREVGACTRAATIAAIDTHTLTGLRPRARRKPSVWSDFPVWYQRGEPWTATNRVEHDRLKALAAAFPTLEESARGTRVGIGVATGADQVFVLEEDVTGIEDDATLPLLLAADVGNDALRWSGRRLLNPFDSVDDGRLIDLARYPGVAAYFRRHEPALRRRHVAKSRIASWYRTIDRVWPSLKSQPKLVMPDIQTGIVVGYDKGDYYPHHNLYWITSDQWDLLALKTLMRSTQVVSQIRAHSVQMRGGAVRFQAQTLRKVRVPQYESIPAELVAELASAASTDDQSLIDSLSARAFALAN
jgi:hypothetical protein